MSAAMNARNQMLRLQSALGEPAHDAPPPPAARFKGVVDRFDPALGLIGWCVELDRPQAAVELELLIDGLAIARARTGSRRDDVCELIGASGDFGFEFEAEIFDRFLAHRAILADKRIAVRIAETGFALPLGDDQARLAPILAAREARADLDETQAFLDRLQSLNAAAADLLAAPYLPSPAPAGGFVEMIAPGANGVLWFVGWADRDHPREFPLAIVDRRKYRAGAVVAGFERDDLPAQACGFVGVLRTDWRPSQAREAIFRVENENGAPWRATRPLRLGKVRDALAHLERAGAGEDAAMAERLIAFAHANDGLDAEPRAHDRVRIAVDAAAMLEGFGVFMKGWIYSPTHAVKRLYLKLGDRQFEADAQSLSFSARPDLLSAFPADREAVARAGFSCIFAADVAGSPLTEVGLRLVYDDASVSSHALPDVALRRLAPDDEGGGFKAFYPHLERQPLFAAYARAYYAQCEAIYGRCEIEAPEPAPIQLVFAAPRERHRLYLMFEELRQNLRRCQARGVGVVLIAGKDARHGEIRELFHALRGDFAGPCSLAFVEDPRFALWSLDGALVALGARRFVFVGADALLDESGWETVASLLAAEPNLAFLELSHPSEGWSAPQASMHAFAWTSQAFLDWRRRRRLPIGLTPSTAAEAREAERRADCGVIDLPPPPPATIQTINCHAGAF